MRSLIKAINSGKPFLVDYQVAEQYLQLKKSAGLTDLITQLFGETPKPYQVGSTYVIPVVGMIAKGLSPFESIGATDVEKLDDQIDEALAANPKRILFHINSDGGTIDGVEELAEKIRALPVETIAYTSGSMNSAAFWIGAAADRVLASSSASVGAIGVYSVTTDLSEQAKSMGIKVKVFRNSSSPYKGMGVAGTSMTEEQEALMQAEVDKAGETFKQSVMQKRKLAKPEDMQGQALSGKDAAARNLITGLVPTLKALLTQLEGQSSPTGNQTAKVGKAK
jgi:ClpP class serine protease